MFEHNNNVAVLTYSVLSYLNVVCLSGLLYLMYVFSLFVYGMMMQLTKISNLIDSGKSYISCKSLLIYKCRFVYIFCNSLFSGLRNNWPVRVRKAVGT